MPACRRQRHPHSVGAPLAPVAAPDDSRRSRLLVKNERTPVFVQECRSCRSAFGAGGAAAGPKRRRHRRSRGSRQIECSSDAKRRQHHRFRAALIARVVDEQETFRKRSDASHNLRSRTSVPCINSPSVLHGERNDARSGMAHTGISNGAAHGRGSRQASGIRRRAYCGSIQPTLSLSSNDADSAITFFAASRPDMADRVRQHGNTGTRWCAVPPAKGGNVMASPTPQCSAATSVDIAGQLVAAPRLSALVSVCSRYRVRFRSRTCSSRLSQDPPCHVHW